MARLTGPLGGAAIVLAGVILLSTRGLGEGVPGSAGLLTVVTLLPTAAVTALAYLLGGFGIGRPLAAWLAPDSEHRRWLQLALGLGAMLTLSHLVGVLGGLSSGGGWGLARVVGWGIVVVGLVLLGDQVVRGPLRPERWPVLPTWGVLWGPGIAVLLVAASNPPGWLWGSEYGAYDALSYHLQLPKEWAAGVRLWPVPHNVYSYLPSYVEAAYLHIGALSIDGAGGSGAGSAGAAARMMGWIDGGAGVDGGESVWVLSCQVLHAGMGVIAALVCGRAGYAGLLRVGADERAARRGGVLAGALVVSTPWVIVAASLAYNEAAVLALGAGAILAGLDASLRPGRRGIVVGALVGVACSAKPTAMFLLGPVAGMVLLWSLPAGTRARGVVAGMLAGIAVMLPWLVRNMLASGNPVFPFASGVFGSAHWSAEQVARYSASHAGGGSGDGGRGVLGVFGRLGLVLSGERGVLHPQWGVIGPAIVVSVLVGLASRATRRLVLVLATGLVAALAGWVFLTHEQSRFLLPLLPGGVVVVALAVEGSRGSVRERLTRRVLGVATCVMMAGWSVRAFLSERAGTPNAALVTNVGGLSGVANASMFKDLSAADRARYLALAPSPQIYLNLGLGGVESGGAARVYLLGDGAPLYVLAALGESELSRVAYHTTWDRSPLGEAIRTSPDDPAAWTRALTGVRGSGGSGFTHVLVNFAELRRLVEIDRYYDPEVTLERVDRWLATLTSEGSWRPVRVWTREGDPATPTSALFEFVRGARGEAEGGR